MKTIAFFDVDHTLIKRSSGLHFAYEAISRKLLKPRHLLPLPFLYLYYRLGPRRKSSKFFAMDYLPSLAGMDMDEITRASREAAHNRIIPDLLPKAQLLVKKEKDNGAIIVLATSTFDFLCEDLAGILAADRIIASQLEFIDGKTTGRIPGGLTLGRRKLELCQEFAASLGVCLENCSFYSDSVHDLPLLQKVGRAIAVNPDKRLKRHAKANNWEILFF